MEETIYKRFCEILGRSYVLVDELMKKHTSFRIGGPADYFIYPDSKQQLCQALALCQEKSLSWFIMGNGSNLLVSDHGYRGVIIQIFKNFQKVMIDGKRITAEAGILLSHLASMACENCLTGLEFSSGIPGTLGGAVVMNAGAYGGEMKDVLSGVTVLDQEGVAHHLSAEELEMGYRTSNLLKQRDWIVVEAELLLDYGEQEKIRRRMGKLKETRCAKQPLEFPSAGSIFKHPKGHFVGKLIMEAGLQGVRVGGAMVSEKHFGFVINVSDATAYDVMTLIKLIQETVWVKFRLRLEPEVEFLGEF